MRSSGGFGSSGRAAGSCSSAKRSRGRRAGSSSSSSSMAMTTTIGSATRPGELSMTTGL